MIFQKFSQRQMMAMVWWNQPDTESYDTIICDGAIRSGKTISMAIGFLLWAMASFEGETFGICGKTIQSLRRNVIMNFPKWLDGVFSIREYRSENKLVVTNGTVSNTFFLFGGRDESSYTLIQGITLAGALLDEVVLMPKSFVEQATARCSVTGSKLWFNCNPEGPEHWFLKEWLSPEGKEKKNVLHMHFTMDDNLSLDPGIKKRYENAYTGVFYRRYILGEWCMAEGLVYQFDRERHITTMAPKRGRWFVSCDYGTVNAFSAGLWCLQANGVAVRVREYYYDSRNKGKQLTDGEYYDALMELTKGVVVETVVVDPSAASFITLMRRRGKFSIRKANNDVMDGIRRTAMALVTGQIKIHEDCADCIREFGLYVWDEKSIEDKPLKTNDHAMDDIRYFCNTILKHEEVRR